MQSIRLLSTGMLGIAALMIVMGGEAFAHGGDPALIHSCVNNSDGTLRLVAPTATCKRNETPADWPASAGPATSPWRVVDSQNQFVGFPVFGGSQVAREVGGVWLLLRATPDGFNWANLGVVLFTTSDCSGTPYLNAVQGFTRVVSGLDADHLMYPDGTPPQSRLISSSWGAGSCHSGLPISLLTQGAVPFDASSLSGLVPPFRLAD